VLTKVNGTNYNTTWATPLNALPLAGGTMNTAASIVLSTATYDSLVNGEVFGVELTADPTQNASLSFNAVTVQDGIGSMQMRADGLTFPDFTTQSTAASPFNGGTVTASVVVDESATSGFTTTFNGDGLQMGGGQYISQEESVVSGYNINLQASGSINNIGTLSFADSTTQTTAAVVFNGGTVGSPISVTGSGGTVSIGDSIGLDLSGSTAGAGITFADSTVQTTAPVAGANFGDAFTLGKVQDVSPLMGYWIITFAPVNNQAMASGLSVSLSDGSSSESITSFSTSTVWTFTTTTLTSSDYIYLTYAGQRSSIPISTP
jgi:hypothetical protein